jgi:hypothetical protein
MATPTTSTERAQHALLQTRAHGANATIQKLQ